MVNKFLIKGNLGVYLVLIELLKRGIDALPTKTFWPFDIITISGLKLEVKMANIGKSRGGSGSISKRFTFRISDTESKILDFVILIPNTHKGYLFYVIPKEMIDSKTIAFNPFSKYKSKYEKFLNRWDLIQKQDITVENKVKNTSKNPIKYMDYLSRKNENS